MHELLDLSQLGIRLRKVDQQIIALLSQRMKLALQVEEWKRAHNQPILRFEIEDKRLAEAREWAKERGINPNFASSVLYFAIRESCSVQLDQLQDISRQDEPSVDEEEEYRKLKENLLALTARIADTYDEDYGADFFATRSYLDFENETLSQEIASLDERDLALDLGCATGRMSFRLAEEFNQIIGYDISPAMIKRAQPRTNS